MNISIINTHRETHMTPYIEHIIRSSQNWSKTIIALSLIGVSYLVGFLWISPAWADQTLYVNQAHPQSSDQNAGTQSFPFKTITKAATIAVENNKNQIGTSILISPGTYRESISLPRSGRETQAPINVEGLGSVVVSGSDVWGNWQRVADTNIYVHPWPYAWSLVAVPDGWAPYITLQDIVRRSEMVFVNGAALQQVLSYGELGTGYFYVDEIAQKIYIQIPEAISIGNALVEVSTRSKLFSVEGKSNLTVKGITFQHASTALDGPAVWFGSSSNILIEECRFQWNNWGGLGVGLSQNVTVRKSVANYNGGAGMTTWKTKTLMFEDNETSYNNWRGKQGGFTGWAVAGMKNLNTHGGMFLRHKSVGNATHGIWFDTDCENILVKQGTFCSNLKLGIFLEANQGPITIQSSKICNNNDYGILIANAAKINLESNIIYGNDGSQIMVSGDNVPRTGTNWETGEEMLFISEAATWKYNSIVGNRPDQNVVATILSSGPWGHFVDTLFSNDNIWFNAQNARTLQIAGGNQIDMETWQSTTKRDLQSSFVDPQFRDAANDDFSLLPGSPLLAMPGWRPSLSPPANFRIAGL